MEKADRADKRLQPAIERVRLCRSNTAAMLGLDKFGGDEEFEFGSRYMMQADRQDDEPVSAVTQGAAVPPEKVVTPMSQPNDPSLALHAADMLVDPWAEGRIG